MTDEIKRNSKGQFIKGAAPIGAGRKKGQKVSPLSDEKLAKLLGRRTESAIDELGKIAMLELDDVKDSPHRLNAKLKALLALLTEDDKARERIYKKTMDSMKQKLEAEKAKNGGNDKGKAPTVITPITL